MPLPLRPRRDIRESEETKVIEINAQMQGSLAFADPVSLKINGNFSGNLQTKGTLTIGENAHVEANIKGDNIIIAGKTTGDITADKMLVLMPTAVLRGDVTTPKLNIVEGAIFQGHCLMIEDLLDITEVAKYLELNLNEIEELVTTGKIPGTKSGDTWKFERRQIDHWAASTKVK